MSEVQKLESLLALVQRNRQKARPVRAAAAAPARVRSATPSPLEVAIGGAADEPVQKPQPKPATPVTQKRPTVAKPAAPRAPAKPAAPARQPAATAPTPVAAAEMAKPSGPIATTNETKVMAAPKTFDELLSLSLSLRPR